MLALNGADPLNGPRQWGSLLFCLVIVLSLQRAEGSTEETGSSYTKVRILPRQTKGAATDMFDLQPPRHISTRRILPVPARFGGCRLTERTPAVQPRRRERVKVPEAV